MYRNKSRDTLVSRLLLFSVVPAGLKTIAPLLVCFNNLQHCGVFLLAHSRNFLPFCSFLLVEGVRCAAHVEGPSCRHVAAIGTTKVAILLKHASPSLFYGYLWHSFKHNLWRPLILPHTYRTIHTLPRLAE